MKKLITLLSVAVSLFAQAQTSNLEVTWDPVPVLDASNLAYRVYYSPQDDSLALKTVESTTTRAVITNLSAGRTYTLHVTAFWISSQIESLPSDVVTYKTPDVIVVLPVLPVPSNLSLLNLSIQPNNTYKVQVSFTAAPSTNVSAYRVVSTSSVHTNTVDTANKSAVVGPLLNDIQYAVTVSSLDSAGNSASSFPIPLKHSVVTNWNGNIKTRSSTVTIGPQ
jgi:hypothetical protein